MFKLFLRLTTLMTFLLILCCKQDVPSAAEKPEVITRENRNMFGHYIPRGLTKTSEGLSEGYVMFSPANSASTYLVNRKGEVVHEWKGNYTVGSVYLNDDGSLSALALDPDFPVFAGGGEAGRIQQISWDSKVVWDFEYANEMHHAHHDIAVKPNGNILTIAWEAKTAAETLQAGRKPEMIPNDGIWPSTIVEIVPNGTRGGEIVWEWHLWDHLVQDFDPEKDNYGVVDEHPELIDINKGRPLPKPISKDSMDKLHAAHRAWRNQTVDNRGSDVYHLNAINYNAELQQVAVSSPNLSEIFIIDQSTTTEEAAGHSGGRWGRGGDILYRWGNPQNYNRGDSTTRQLFGQHDVRWVEKGKHGYGNLTVYNNYVPMGPDSLDYSAIYELELPVDEQGNYVTGEKTFGPEKPVWTYVAPDTLSFYGSFISGAHRMENGNTFINEGPRGRFFEVTPDGETVWEYLNPYRGNVHHPNGDPISAMPFTYYQFRSTFIPKDHPGLKGKELQPLEPQPEVFKLPPRPEK